MKRSGEEEYHAHSFLRNVSIQVGMRPEPRLTKDCGFAAQRIDQSIAFP